MPFQGKLHMRALDKKADGQLRWFEHGFHRVNSLFAPGTFVLSFFER